MSNNRLFAGLGIVGLGLAFAVPADAQLLARIDGKSPAEYITEPLLRKHIRGFARNLVLQPPARVSDVFEQAQRCAA